MTLTTTELDYNNLPLKATILNEYFLIYVTKQKNHFVDFIVFQRLSFGTHASDGTKLPDQVEAYLEGTIKWDGCSHITYVDEGVPDSYKHLCGAYSWAMVLDMHQAAYRYVMSIMSSADETELLDKYIEEFAKSNITQSDAEDLAIINEEFVQQCANLAPANLDSINPAKQAYHLAYSNPELGTKLLDELLYYQNLGRI